MRYYRGKETHRAESNVATSTRSGAVAACLSAVRGIAGSGSGNCLAAPFDVLIRRVPRLQVRQPDLLFISKAALARSGGIPERVPLQTAPELVVEILSDSDRESVLSGKIMDYLSIGVWEVWLVRPDVQTVEILNLTSGQAVSEAVYSASETAEARVFTGLRVEVAGLFQEG